MFVVMFAVVVFWMVVGCTGCAGDSGSGCGEDVHSSRVSNLEVGIAWSL